MTTTVADLTKRVDTPGPGTPSRASGAVRATLQLIRPGQWVKNGFVLAPLLFSGQFRQALAVTHALEATLVFTLASCMVYILNDLQDIAADRRHPVKRLTRPLASGALSVTFAKLLLASFAVAVIAAAALRPTLAGALGLYVALNIGYSLRLKHVPVVDLFCIAAGFVLRIYVGALAIAVPLSSWMLTTTLALALYLAAIKRREELTRSGLDGRIVLGAYSPELLDRYALIAAASAIIFYSLFVMTVRPELELTISFVLFGLFRYWYIVEKSGGESPTDALWRDLPLALTVVAWVALCATKLQK